MITNFLDGFLIPNSRIPLYVYDIVGELLAYSKCFDELFTHFG